jgi:predicted nucleic acid-binding protein
MSPGELVVSNTSPVLNLALIGRLDLLEAQFETVHTPDAVWNELTAGEEGLAENCPAKTRASEQFSGGVLP